MRARKPKCAHKNAVKILGTIGYREGMVVGARCKTCKKSYYYNLNSSMELPVWVKDAR